MHAASKIFPGLFACLLLLSCKSQQSSAPKNLSGFTVQLEYTAGMLPDYKNIYISADSCYSEARNRGQVSRHTFTCTTDELKALQDMADRYHFYSMRSEDHGRVYDRGGTMLQMGPKGKTYTVKDSGNDFLLEQYREDFRKITDEIYGLVKKKTGQ